MQAASGTRAGRRLTTVLASIRPCSPATDPTPAPIPAAAADGGCGCDGEAARMPLLHEGLTAAEQEFFDREGYVVIRQCATPEQVRRLWHSTWRQLGMAPTEPDGWYTPPPPNGTWKGGPPCPFHHAIDFRCQATPAATDADSAAAWEIATNPRMHAVFSDLLGVDQLWATIGQGSFKPPWRTGLPKYEHICHAGWKRWYSLGDALPMHWDMSMAQFERGCSPSLFVRATRHECSF